MKQFTPVRSAKRLIWSYLTRSMHLDWNLRSGIPIIIRSYADWCSYNEMFANAEYTKPIMDALAARDRLAVLDLGANVGYFSLRLLDLYLQQTEMRAISVWMVEASPGLCKELRQRVVVKRGGVDLSIVSGLVGKRDGSGRLNYAKEDNQNFVNDSPRCDAWRQVRGVEELQYIDLELLVGNVPTIDLIKCDIEGSEFQLIDNYPDLLRRTQRLVVEFHAAFGDSRRATKHLVELGFNRVTVLRDDPAVPVVYFTRDGEDS